MRFCTKCTFLLMYCIRMARKTSIWELVTLDKETAHIPTESCQALHQVQMNV